MSLQTKITLKIECFTGVGDWPGPVGIQSHFMNIGFFVSGEDVKVPTNATSPC